MKILVLAVHFEVTGARYIADAFTRLGHDVKHVGATGRLKEAWGVDIPLKYQWMPDNLGLWLPDLIIIADTLTPEYAIPKAYRGAPVIKWVQDNHVRNVRENGIAHYFLAHAHGPAQPVTHDNETWLPCATNATVFTPSAIPWDEREYDICCIGVMYPQRIAAIEALREAGFKVFAATGLVYDEFKAAYHNSRASLCMSVNGDLAQRVFETAGMGCLVITDLLRDLEDDVTRGKLGLHGFACTGFTVDNPNNISALVEQCEILLKGKGDPLYIEQAKAGAAQLQAIVLEKHTWDARAQVVVDWYQKEYGVADIVVTSDKVTVLDKPIDTRDIHVLGGETVEDITFFVDEYGGISRDAKPYLNLGCGKTHLPSYSKPAGHEAVDDAIYRYPLWVNVDKVEGVGADKVFDLFSYPWPLETSAYDGALVAHFIEHLPHEIKLADDSERAKELSQLQDGYYAFMSELYRVLTPNAIVHIVSPYGHSDGAIVDPSHTRYLTVNSFTHSMTPEISDGSTFKYNNGGINFVIEGEPVYRLTEIAELIGQRTGLPMNVLLMAFNNICYDMYLKLKCIK